MPAGINRVCRLTTFSYPQDDVVGGSVPSGTVVYENINIRIASEKPVMALVQQGLETEETFSASFHPGNANVDHNDQIEITAPKNDWYFGKKFRIVSVQRSSNVSQDRNTIRVTLRRFDQSRTNDLQ